MEKYQITIKSYYNNQYRNIFREFDSQDNLNKYVSAVNNSGYSKVVGVKNVTEQRLKENLIKDIYNTDVKLHHSYDMLYDDLIHKSVERLESILDGIKNNYYICTIN
tara:strand:+ start:78 stop:398 length:321 start_codon:yes stop_codon:yes gene_type:complete